MIAVVDYGMGNVRSVMNALALLGAPAILTQKKEDLEAATHIILPGVGAFQDGMARLNERGLVPILENEVRVKKKPFLGICLGMQLLASVGEEGQETKGMGWIEGRVRKIHCDERKFRLPHIGWNDVALKTSPLLTDISSPVFYFVHSFVLDPRDPLVAVGTCDYGENFAAIIQKDNIFGTQFHPEKSQKSGLTLLKNFIAI